MGHKQFEGIMTSFTIKASPGTDIWRKPPSTDVFNGICFLHAIFLHLL